MNTTKLLTLGLATGLMVSGGMLNGLTASADIKADPNNPNRSILDGSKDAAGQVETSANIPTTGSLGFDNTVNPPVDPTDSNQFLNVTFPTKAAYYTDNKTDHKAIISAKHTIRNKSSRPVRVDVKSFDIRGTATAADFGGLQITADKTANGTGTDVAGTPVNLITTGALADFSTAKTLMTLDSPLADAPSYDAQGKVVVADTFKGTATADYSFTGTTSGSTDFTKHAKQAESTMVLEFTPLQPDGSAFS